MQIHPWPGDINKAWKSTYHFVYGHCQSFDPQIQGITNISVTDTKGHPELQFRSIKHGLVDWYDMDMIIHNRDDFQDAHILHDKDKISSMTKDKIFKLSKKVVNSISTRKFPCQKYAKTTCILRHMNTFYHEKYQCQIVFIRDYIDMKSLKQHCNISVHLEFNQTYPELFLKYSSTCISSQGCIQTNYIIDSSEDFKAKYGLHSSTIKISINKPIVEYYIEEISYDFQSLVGEVGGTLGLTVGLSFLSISDWTMTLIKSYFKRR